MPTLIDSIDAALFDIGSTLVEGPSVSPAKEIAKRFGLHGETALRVGRLIMCTDLAGPADVCDVLAACGKMMTSDDVAFISRLWSDQETAAAAIDGALETVRFFAAAGKTIGLLSDIWSPYYRAFERACPEICEMAGAKTLSFKAGIKKPDAAFHQAAIRALAIVPERILMIGDTYENDIAPAIREGMKTAWILSRAEREVPALVGVVNGQLPRPDVTVGLVTELASAVGKEQARVHQDHRR